MNDLIYLGRIGLTCLLSFLIGYERELQDKNAGLRTIMLIGLGATIFTLLPFILLILSKELNFSFDFSRIIAYTVSSVGFLAGIVIIVGKKKVEGITTSACIWAVVSMGILSGLGSYLLAVITAILIWLILKLKYIRIKIQLNSKGRKRNEKIRSN